MAACMVLLPSEVARHREVTALHRHRKTEERADPEKTTPMVRRRHKISNLAS